MKKNISFSLTLTTKTFSHRSKENTTKRKRKNNT